MFKASGIAFPPKKQRSKLEPFCAKRAFSGTFVDRRNPQGEKNEGQKKRRKRGQKLPRGKKRKKASQKKGKEKKARDDTIEFFGDARADGRGHNEYRPKKEERRARKKATNV